LVSQYYYEIKWEYNKIGAIYGLFFVSAMLILLLRIAASYPYEVRLIVKSMSIISYFYLGVKLRVMTMENFVIIKNMLLLKKAALV